MVEEKARMEHGSVSEEDDDHSSKRTLALAQMKLEA